MNLREKAFLAFAAEAEEGKGRALSKDGVTAATAASRAGHGTLLETGRGQGKMYVFIINQSGRAALSAALKE